MKTQIPTFGMVAGEPSGDLLAGLLLDGMIARWPALHAVGIGGPQMVRRGFKAWWPQQLLAVRGYVEVLPHLFKLLSIRRELGDRLLIDEPDCFIGIDAPDFNFGLEERLKKTGVPTVHFVSPSFWAWRANKLEKLKRSADHVLCIFPFEPALLAAQGIAATYVGHPLANVIPMVPDRAAARAHLGLADADVVLAILPGSRQSEVKHLAQLFFEAARLVLRAQPAVKLAVPALPHLKPAILDAAKRAGVNARLTVVEGQSHTVLAACDLTLIASGTATLEAALFKRPMVIAYTMPWLSYQIMKRKQLQPWVGLPNILCGEFIVPEFIQHAATPQGLAQSLLDWLASPEKIQAVQARFVSLHHELNRDTTRLACDVIQTLCDRKVRQLPAR